ncbi:MAG: hypothetical protein ABIQ75_01195 [Flavobacteriales bacterium]
MKRHLLAVTALVAAIASTQAQEQYRPVGGEGNLELMIAPLGGSPVTMAGIKYRHFGSATSAFRMGIFLGYQNKTTITQDEATNPNMLELKKKESGINISLQPGIEKHMTGTDRLSPYIGGYVDLNYSTTNKTVETQLDLNIDKREVGYTKDTKGSLGIGLNAVAGFDYYLAKSLYFGTELGFGFAATMPMKSKSETVAANSDNTGTATTNTDGKKDNVSSIQVGPNVVGQFRLGWIF